MLRQAPVPEKVCLITGASDGLGLAAAKQLAQPGLHLILIGRNAQKVEKARQEIVSQCKATRITVYCADLSSQQEIKTLSAKIHQQFAKIDILINNAGGVFADFSLTEDGLEKTIALNHFNYFLLTSEVFDLLQQSSQARIINVASNSHFQGKIDFESFTRNRGHSLIKAYSQSKLANLLFTYELDRRLQGTHLTVNAISPGRVRTAIGNKGQPWYVSWIWTLLTRIHSRKAEQSAKVYAYLATDKAIASVTGSYFNQHLVRISSSNQSHDPALAKQLWEYTEKHTGVSFNPAFSFQKHSE